MEKFLKELKQLDTKINIQDSSSIGKKDFYIETDKIEKIINLFKKETARLITLTTYSNSDGEIFIYYHFDLKNSVFTVKTKVVNFKINSITKKFPAAFWIEKEIHEMYGIKFIGHKKLTNLLLTKKIKTPFLPRNKKKGKYG